MQQFISHSYARMVLILDNKTNTYGGAFVPPYRMIEEVKERTVKRTEFENYDRAIMNKRRSGLEEYVAGFNDYHSA